MILHITIDNGYISTGEITPQFRPITREFTRYSFEIFNNKYSIKVFNDKLQCTIDKNNKGIAKINKLVLSEWLHLYFLDNPSYKAAISRKLINYIRNYQNQEPQLKHSS